MSAGAWGATIFAGAFVVAGAAAASRFAETTPRDPYVEHLRERIAALRPAVERELGAPIPGPIRVVVDTRRAFAELDDAETREILTSVDGEPPRPSKKSADEPPRESIGILACVDAAGTIHVCRQELEGAPSDADSDVARLLGGSGRSAGYDADQVDRTLVHELVHVYDTRAFGAWAYLLGARDRSDLLARQAVLEGHAEAVAKRVTGHPAVPDDAASAALFERLSQTYALFENDARVARAVFRYRQGDRFFESVLPRLGRDEAVRRAFAEPPTLLQIARPETWPLDRAPDAGTDALLRRARSWLDEEWESADCGPLPPDSFLELLRTATAERRRAAEDALLEVQRIETKGAALWNSVRGHLVAARDAAGARSLYDAWIEAARARDVLVPSDPKLEGKRVLRSAWSDGDVDGRPAAFASRMYAGAGVSDYFAEDAVVVRSGRYVLELRLIDDPGADRAVGRLARRLLALIAPATENAVADSWDARWRVAADPRSATERIRPLLADADADVRHAALSNLLRRGATIADERARLRKDPDPLVRLAALTWSPPDKDAPQEDLLAATRDADPWVAAGGFFATRARFDDLPDEAIEAGLRRPEGAVRRQAAGVLANHDARSADAAKTLALVRLAIADDDPCVRMRGVGPLLHLPSGTAGLAETFAALLAGADEHLRTSASIDLSIREAVPGLATALILVLDDPDLRDNAVVAVAKLGKDAAAAAPSLRRIADPTHGSKDAAIRLRALAALGAVTDDRSEIVAEMRRLFASGTEADAAIAAAALEMIGDAEIELVPELTAALRLRHRGVALQVLDALVRIGAPAACALPTIDGLIARDDPVVARAARSAAVALRRSAERSPASGTDRR